MKKSFIYLITATLLVSCKTSLNDTAGRRVPFRVMCTDTLAVQAAIIAGDPAPLKVGEISVLMYDSAMKVGDHVNYREYDHVILERVK